MGLSKNYVITGVQLMIRAKILSVLDRSAPFFIYVAQTVRKYLQLLSFMAVWDKFGLCYGQTIEA